MYRSRCRFVVMVVLLGVVLTANLAGQAAAAPPTGGTRLTFAVGQAPGSGVIVVSGHGFSSGGHVYVALFDQQNGRMRQARWVTASLAYSLRDGSVDPASEGPFAPGGAISETFSGLCRARVMAAAWGQWTGAWTNWIAVAPQC